MNKIYVFGGLKQYSEKYKRTHQRSVDRYNPKIDKWDLLELCVPFSMESCVFIPYDYNEFLIIGGRINC